MGVLRRVVYGLLIGLLATEPSLAQTASTVTASTETSLTLTVSEASVLVSVDGAVKGVTPLEGPLTLPAGRHRLELFKAGFERLTREVELAPGSQTLSITLQPEVRLGKLSVGASSLPADLLIDGRNVGALPWTGEITPGEHVLVAQNEAAASAELRTQVGAGDTTVVSLSLLPRTAQIEIEVPDAAIYVDDARVGVGTWSGGVRPGAHRVQLKRIGFASKEYEVTLAADEVWKVSNITWDAPSPGSAPEARPKLDLRGPYGQLGLFGLFSRRTTDELRRECPAASTTPGGSCQWYSSYGGGLSLRIGYSFGFIAVEGVALGLADGWYDESRYTLGLSSADSDFYGPPRTEQYTFLRYGGGVALGARLLTPTRGVRATLGVNFGVLERWERYFRVASATTRVTTPLGTSSVPDARADNSDVDTDTSALLLVDAGVLFGNTPGLKFQLGLLLAATFGSASEVPATRGGLGRDGATGKRGAFGSGAIDISHGSQLFFGPTLGVQFGY